MGWPRLLVSLLMGATIAGCLGATPDTQPEGTSGLAVPTIQEPGPFLFHHGGGRLDFETDASVILAVYSPQDLRLARYALGEVSGIKRASLDADAIGDYVVVVHELQGNLTIRSSGRDIAVFEPLGLQFERFLVAEAPPQFEAPFFTPPFTGQAPLDVDMAFNTSRVPTAMRLLATGEVAQVEIVVTGTAGPVLELMQQNGGVSGGEEQLRDMHAEQHPSAFRGTTFELTAQADSFYGAIVLESWSYSRAVHRPLAPAQMTAEEPLYRYGDLPPDPIRFEVHERATALYLGPPGLGDLGSGFFEDECEPPDAPAECDAGGAWVSLYDPGDQWLGTYLVPDGETIRVPVDAGGEYVAVLKRGSASLAADAVPTDFEIHPMESVATVFPDDAPGGRYDWGVRNGSQSVPGIVIGATFTFHDTGRDLSGSLLAPCSDPGTVRVLQDGEVLGYYGEFDGPDPVRGLDGLALFMAPGPVEFVQDGMGGTCGHWALRVYSYER